MIRKSTNLLFFVIAFFISIIFLANSVLAVDVWSEELLINPGFEFGNLTGWVTSGSGWEVGVRPSSGTSVPQTGNYCLYNNGASQKRYYVYQDVDLTDYAESIDSGNAMINISAWGISSEYNIPVWDQTRIQFIFLDAAKSVISTPKDTGYINSNLWWKTSLSEYPLPENTRYVRVWGNTYEPYYDSGSLDSFSVKIKILGSPCIDSCSSLGYECGMQEVCGEMIDCGECAINYLFSFQTMDIFEPIILADCETITDLNGYYKLSSNVTAQGTCFNVSASNVTLDCDNNWIIYGTDGDISNIYGIYSNQYGITIRNCNILDGDMYSFQPLRYGIYLDNSHNSNIYNNSVMGWGVDESSGIYISSSNNTTISNNSLRIRNDGIILYNSFNNSIIDNFVSVYSDGNPFKIDHSDKNILIRNTGINTAPGSSWSNAISFYSSSNNTLLFNNWTLLGSGPNFVNSFVVSVDDFSSGNIFDSNGIFDYYNLSDYAFSIEGKNNFLIKNTIQGKGGFLMRDNSGNIFSENKILVTGVGALLFYSSNNVFTNNTIKAGDAGMSFIGSLNNLILYPTIISGGDFAVGFGGSNNTVFMDCSNISSKSTDILYYTSSGPSVNNTFINCSYRTENVQGAGSELIRKWYYSARVLDDLSTPVSNAEIFAYNALGYIEFLDLTNSLGFIDKQEVTDYVNTEGVKTYFSNYIINATKENYETDTILINFTSQQNKLEDLFFIKRVVTWSEELLINPGFEFGNLTGWVTSGSGWQVGVRPSGGSSAPQEGSYCVYNNYGSQLAYSIYQDVDLTDYAESIDSGNAVINISAWGISSEYNIPAWDQTRIQFIFLDATKSVISTPKDTGYINSNLWWKTSLSEYPLPENTRYVRVWGNTYETEYDSGSLDSFSVKIRSLNTGQTCTETCTSLGYTCGNVCGVDCGTCSLGYYCNFGTCIGCTSHSTSACYNGDVYWYNSCGDLEDIRYDCNSTQTCSSGQCLNIKPISQIIADHTSVDKYDDIPQCYIDEVKKMLVNIGGESHSMGYQNGANLLELYDSRFQVQTYEDTTPLSENDQYLRLGRPHMYGEDIWTSQAGIDNLIGDLDSQNDTGNPFDVFAFGWCWDMTWENLPGGTEDPIFNVHWAGSSEGGANGSMRWGLDAGDEALTGNVVSMDNYLDAIEQYNSYFKSNNIPTVVVFTTGPVDSYTDENAYQRELKQDYIRQYVLQNESRILFDYADILIYNNNGEKHTEEWDDNGEIRSYSQIHPDNLLNYDQNWNMIYGEDYDGDHIGQVGALRIAKAEWWMLARMAGWDGVSTTCS